MQKIAKKFVILGASRGLGWATYLQLSTKIENEFLLADFQMYSMKFEVPIESKIITNG